MKAQISTLILKKFFIFFGFLILCACSSEPKDPSDSSIAAEGDYHDANTLNDTFGVKRELPKHENKTSNSPFFFKRCSQSFGDYYNTRTRYECDEE
jgi:hypothetical protein